MVIGSVSEGTLKAEDLVPILLEEIRVDRPDIADYIEHDVKENIISYEDALSELITELNMVIPPYCYFGTHPSDGANFGYWIETSSIEEDIKCGILTPIHSLTELKSVTTEFAVLLDKNDNFVMLLWCNENDRWEQLWSV